MKMIVQFVNLKNVENGGAMLLVYGLERLLADHVCAICSGTCTAVLCFPLFETKCQFSSFLHFG
jgi:hypothetical protein